MPSETAIHCLLIAAKYNSFTKAAEELYMTRQAVSKQISGMEKELGVKLFDRTTARVALTPIGEIYVDFFLRFRKEWKQTQEKVDEILNREGHNIKIGCLYSTDIGAFILNKVEKLRAEGIQMTVTWERREASELLKYLINGSFDMVFVFEREVEQFARKEELRYFTLLETQAVIAASQMFPGLSDIKSPKDFSNVTCYLAEGMQGKNKKQGVEEEFASSDIYFSDIEFLPNRESVQTMVEMGRGITICTDIERFVKDPDIKSFPIPKYQRILCVTRQANQNEVLSKFLQELQNQ